MSERFLHAILWSPSRTMPATTGRRSTFTVHAATEVGELV